MKTIVLAAIFARGGSKSIPRKNIKLLNGKPLIAYAIETAKAVAGVHEVIVSTDDLEIVEIARAHGASVPFVRPAELATDSAPEILSWQHAVDSYERLKDIRVDVLLSVPPTSPLREVADVQGCLEALLASEADVALGVTDAHRSPYFNMLKEEQGYGRLVMQPPPGGVFRRQDAPKVFDIATVAYAVRRSYLREAKTVLEGKVKMVHLPVERALDIDTPFDWELAEFLLAKRSCA